MSTSSAMRDISFLEFPVPTRFKNIKSQKGDLDHLVMGGRVSWAKGEKQVEGTGTGYCRPSGRLWAVGRVCRLGHPRPARSLGWARTGCTICELRSSAVAGCSCGMLSAGGGDSQGRLAPNSEVFSCRGLYISTPQRSFIIIPASSLTQ